MDPLPVKIIEKENSQPFRVAGQYPKGIQEMRKNSFHRESTKIPAQEAISRWHFNYDPVHFSIQVDSIAGGQEDGTPLLPASQLIRLLHLPGRNRPPVFYSSALALGWRLYLSIAG